MIEVALLDELFHSNRPVLTGVDADSTYCFLLEEVEHRDAEIGFNCRFGKSDSDRR